MSVLKLLLELVYLLLHGEEVHQVGLMLQRRLLFSQDFLHQRLMQCSVLIEVFLVKLLLQR